MHLFSVHCPSATATKLYKHWEHEAKPSPWPGEWCGINLLIKFSVPALRLTAKLPLEEVVKRCKISPDGSFSQIPALSLTVMIIPCYLPLVFETAAYEIHWFMCASGLHKPLFSFSG